MFVASPAAGPFCRAQLDSFNETARRHFSAQQSLLVPSAVTTHGEIIPAREVCQEQEHRTQ